MAKSLDQLIGHLLEEIALTGEQGATFRSVVGYARRFYARPNLKSLSSDEPQTTFRIDRGFIGKLWKWLSQHEDIAIGFEGESWKSTLYDVVEVQCPGITEAILADRIPLEDDDAADIDESNALGVEPEVVAEGPRFSTSLSRMYQAICGHEPDASRIFPTEFAILCVVASRRSAGILQGELVRVTGQDKRSVPKRTDALAVKGYIVKRVVWTSGHKTSRITLRRFVQPEDDRVLDNSDTYTLHSFAQQIFTALQEETFTTQDDLASKTSSVDPARRRVMQSVIKHFVANGCLKKVKVVPGQSSHAASAKICIQVLRQPEEVDYQMTMSGTIDLSTSVESALLAARQTLQNLQPGSAESLDCEDEENTHEDVMGSESPQPRPQWSSRRQITNALFDVVQNSGTTGVTNVMMRERLTGLTVRRPVESLLTRVSHASLKAQPDAVRNMSVVRSWEVQDAVGRFVHRTFNQYQSLVYLGQAKWSVVEGGKMLHAKLQDYPPCQTEDLQEKDSFGFVKRTVPKGQFPLQSQNLDSIAKGCKALPMQVRRNEPFLKEDDQAKSFIEWQSVDHLSTSSPQPTEPASPSTQGAARMTKNPGKKFQKSEKTENLVNASLGRPRKFTRGTEKFWQEMFVIRHREDFPGDKKSKPIGLSKDQRCLRLLQQRPLQFDEMIVRAIDLGLPVPNSSKNVSQAWVDRMNSFLIRKQPGAYFTPSGMKINSKKLSSCIVVIRSPRMRGGWPPAAVLFLSSSRAHTSRSHQIPPKALEVASTMEVASTATRSVSEENVEPTNDPSLEPSFAVSGEAHAIRNTNKHATPVQDSHVPIQTTHQMTDSLSIRPHQATDLPTSSASLRTLPLYKPHPEAFVPRVTQSDAGVSRIPTFDQRVFCSRTGPGEIPSTTAQVQPIKSVDAPIQRSELHEHDTTTSIHADGLSSSVQADISKQSATDVYAQARLELQSAATVAHGAPSSVHTDHSLTWNRGTEDYQAHTSTTFQHDVPGTYEKASSVAQKPSDEIGTQQVEATTAEVQELSTEHHEFENRDKILVGRDAVEYYRHFLYELVVLAGGMVPYSPPTLKRAMRNKSLEADCEPDLNIKLVKSGINILVKAGRLKFVHFAYQRKGFNHTKTIIALPHIQADDPQLKALQAKLASIPFEEEYVLPELNAEIHRAPLHIKRRVARCEPKTFIVQTPVVKDRKSLRGLREASIVSEHRIPSPSPEPPVVTANTGFLTLKVPRISEIQTERAFSAHHIVLQTYQSTDPGAVMNTRTIQWQKINAMPLPKSFRAIIQQERTNPLYDQPDAYENVAASTFARSVDIVADWEERNMANFEDQTPGVWNFINHLTPAKQPVHFFANSLTRICLLTFVDGEEVENDPPELESWLPFAEIVRARKPLGKKRKRQQEDFDDVGAEADHEISAAEFSDDEDRPVKRKRKTRTRIVEPKLRKRKARVADGPGRQERAKRAPRGIGMRHLPKDQALRLGIVFTVVRTLLGGIDRHMNFSLAQRLIPEESENSLRERFKRMHSFYGSDMDALAEDFQIKYLDALADGQVPSVNFDDIDSTDWDAIVEWATKNISTSSEGLRELPPTKDESLALYNIELSDSSSIRGIFNHTLFFTLGAREDAWCATVFGTDLNPTRATTRHVTMNYPAEDLEEDEVKAVARSWIIAILLTPQHRHHARRTHQKLMKLTADHKSTDEVLDQVIRQLQADKIIMRTEGGVSEAPDGTLLAEARGYRLSARFFDRFESNRAITTQMLRDAYWYKTRILDPAAVAGQPVHVPKDVNLSDGAMMAIFNLLSMKMLRILPGDDVPASRYGLDWEKEGYKTRSMDKSILCFSTRLEATTQYVAGDPLEAARTSVPIPRGSVDETTIPVPIPLWFDINIDLQVPVWEMVVGSVLGLVSVRPGVSSIEAVRTMAWAMSLRDMEMVLEYLLARGCVRRLYDGWETTEWWWCALGSGHITDVQNVANVALEVGDGVEMVIPVEEVGGGGISGVEQASALT